MHILEVCRETARVSYTCALYQYLTRFHARMTATPPAATLSVDAEYGLRLPDPTQLASASDIHNALRALEAEESQVDEELSVLMGDRALLETLLDRIDGVRPVVELVQLEAEDLAKRVDETADIAERISGKVRQLDLEQVG